MKKRLQIDIISDVVCPWCYIGKKKLDQALTSLPDDIEIKIDWRPFQLAPEIPDEGSNFKEHLSAKFGSIQQLDSMFQRLKGIGESVGINFQMDAIQTTPNTLKLHALLEEARSTGLQTEFSMKLFKAYFEEGKNLSDPEIVKSIWKEMGWELETFDSIWSDSESKSEIKREIEYYQRNGISGVPFFIIDNQFGVSGAQDSSVFLDFIQKALQ
jgi:predicted DsbA family dithiol-disulfide isomerase